MGDDDDCLDDANDVKQVLKQVGVGQQLVEELQDALYDQLAQYTKGELLADIQIEGTGMSFESYRKAFHRARNRVSRPETQNKTRQ